MGARVGDEGIPLLSPGGRRSRTGETGRVLESAALRTMMHTPVYREVVGATPILLPCLAHAMPAVEMQ